MRRMMLAVFDLDGTLADDIHRQHHLDGDEPDWDCYFGSCAVDPAEPRVCLLAATLYDSPAWHSVEIWTGRPEKVREATEKWLAANGVRYDALRMRADGDHRKNAEYKGELVERYGRPDVVFEDRVPAAAWWRRQGITCLQVADHDY